MDHGANIDAVDEEYQSTPLGLAARAGHRNIVELSLKRGADPSKSGAAWSTPPAWAEKYDRAEIAALLQASIRQRE